MRTRQVLSNDLKFGNLNLLILDFAGQFEEYVSHSLFAQDAEALYCIVVDISEPIATVQRKASAWCSFIGGISAQKPSVLLIATHLDKRHECEHEALIMNLYHFLKRNHLNVSMVGCARVNYRADRIVDSLKNIKVLLYNTLQRQLKGMFIPKSYVLANQCLQKEFVERQKRQNSQIFSFEAVHKLLIQKVPKFYDNVQFLVRVLKYLHNCGTLLYSQSNNFIVLEPYTWLTNILCVFLPESGKASLLEHQHGLRRFDNISKHYELFHCKRADVTRIMQLLCEYDICIRVPMVPSNNPGFVFPSLLPRIDVKVLKRYWCASPVLGETFVGREVRCKNPIDSISQGLFCSLQVRLNREALMEHKGAICVLRKDIILIRTSEGTIKVVLNRDNNSLNAANTHTQCPQT